MRHTVTRALGLVSLALLVLALGASARPASEPAPEPAACPYTQQEVEDATVQAIYDVTGIRITDPDSQTFAGAGVQESDSDAIKARIAEILGVSEIYIYAPYPDWPLATIHNYAQAVADNLNNNLC